MLDPVREPLSALEQQRAAMTPLVFSAQFQQSPIPLEGNLIKRDWIRYHKGNLPPQEGDYFVISWDTAMKATELADYSVGTVWHVQNRGRKINLVDLVRGRFEYPELVAAALALWRKWRVERIRTNLVIEGARSKAFDAARTLSVTEGQWVQIETPGALGSCKAKVKITDATPESKHRHGLVAPRQHGTGKWRV